MADEETTTIQVTVKTRGRLASLGAKDETFDQIIVRLLDDADKKAKK